MTSETITIVSGLPRSGTSMMMQMLSAGGIEPFTDGARIPDEDNPRGYYELDAIKRLASDPSPILEASGKSVKVIHRLLAHLPAGPLYAVVFMHRHFDEVIASQKAMLERLGRDGAKLETTRLRMLYRNEVEVALTHARSRNDVELFEVQHAEVMSDPERTSDQVAAFLESIPGWSTSMNRPAMAASVDQKLHRQHLG